jgi:hypothetical protein
MRVATRTLQVPTRWGMGAFSPGLSGSATASFNGQHIISGAPGTVRVPSPAPAAMDDSALGGPFNQPSRVAPNWFLPCLYTFHANPTVHFPGRLFGDNVLPTPIPNPQRTALQLQHRWRIGGRTATASLRPFTRWPTYNMRGR